MSHLLSRTFWLDAAERAVKTVAQAALVAIGTDTLDIISADWVGIMSVAVGGGILSLLMSVASAPLGPSGDRASLVVD